jgi:undecaprenyl-diphosphatase
VTFVQAMLLAVLQGVSELFPISSLGHTVLLPALLRWNVDEGSESFLAFVVVLHLGTALALIVFYRREWLAIVRALVVSVVRGRFSDDVDERTAWLLVAGTVPVGILGVLFQSTVKHLFASPIPVSLFLCANGFLMLFGEWLRRRQHANADHPYRRLEDLALGSGVFVGLVQSLALLPGISLEIPTLFAPDAHVALLQSVAGCVVAGVTAYASIVFLTRWFKHNDLTPFAWYCVVAGGGAFLLFATKVIA